jgi:hypothetical protein
MLRMCYTVSAYKIIKGLIITCCRECYVAELWFLLLQKRIDLALYLVEDSLSNVDDNSFHTFVILHLKTKTPNTLVQYCSFFGYKITISWRFMTWMQVYIYQHSLGVISSYDNHVYECNQWVFDLLLVSMVLSWDHSFHNKVLFPCYIVLTIELLKVY